MTIPFICVNYNTVHETIKYVQNIKSLVNNEEAFVIVVDNSPSNEDFEVLKNFVVKNNYSGHDVVILKKENKGYFQGLNDGIIYARELNVNSSFYIVGNNDIIFKNDFITQLKNIKLNENVLVLAPDIITNKNSHENPHVISRIGFLQKFKYDVYYSNYIVGKILSKLKSVERRFKPYDPIRKEIHMGIGALYILTTNFFKHFEKLSEEVFLYGEEAILAGQINSVNGKIVYEPALVCYHNESATTSKLDSKSKYEIVQKSYLVYRKYL